MKSIRVFATIALLAAVHHAPFAQTAPSIVAIRGGTILTVTRGTIQNGTIVLRDGKIAAIGGAGGYIFHQQKVNNQNERRLRRRW